MQKEMIRVTRYRRDPSRPSLFPAAGLPLPFALSFIRWAGTPTNTVDGGGDPTGPPKIGPGARLRPLGVKPANVSSTKQSPGRSPGFIVNVPNAD